MSRIITTPLGLSHHHHAELKLTTHNGGKSDAVLVASATNIARAPLIISCPHAGRYFPAEFENDITVSLHELDRRGDTFTEWLSMGAVDHGAFQIISTIAPTYLNVGRSTKSIDCNDVRDWKKQSLPCDYSDIYANIGQGLISTKNYLTGQPFYKDGHLPNASEILHRIEKWYTPFHNKLTEIAENTADIIAPPLVFDVHSCPSSSKIGGEIRADIILSDADGKSCDPEIMAIAQNIAKKFNLSVAINDPYKGGYITQRYGRHGVFGQKLGSQAIQIEFNRKSYGLNEQTLKITDTSKFNHAQKFTTELSGAFIDHLMR